ncbi:MAG: hypothetical protein IAI49_08585 [Candidatus Eremiobacteraeota bacterium]|nr:hypothetical protein [Candidatus Eremiobacteraeota bacterium]
MLEGSRSFDIVWGSVTGTFCFAIGACVLAMWLRERGRGTPSMFGAAVDPERKLMFAWGIFAMMMGGTNFGCRYIDHAYLEGVHEGFFALTLLVTIVLVPRLAWLAFVRRRTTPEERLAA